MLAVGLIFGNKKTKCWRSLLATHKRASRGSLVDARAITGDRGCLEEVQLTLQRVHTRRRQTAVAATSWLLCEIKRQQESSTTTSPLPALVEPLYSQNIGTEAETAILAQLSWEILIQVQALLLQNGDILVSVVLRDCSRWRWWHSKMPTMAPGWNQTQFCGLPIGVARAP